MEPPETRRLPADVIRSLYQNFEGRVKYHHGWGPDPVLAIVTVNLPGYWDAGEICEFRLESALRLEGNGVLEIIAVYKRVGDGYQLCEDGVVPEAESTRETEVVDDKRSALVPVDEADARTLAEMAFLDPVALAKSRRRVPPLVHPLGTRTQAGRPLEGGLLEDEW